MILGIAKRGVDFVKALRGDTCRDQEEAREQKSPEVGVSLVEDSKRARVMQWNEQEKSGRR